jgi:RNA polymerase sigma factor (sigma-70 family)
VDALKQLERLQALDTHARKRLLRRMLINNLLDRVREVTAVCRDARLEVSLEEAAAGSACRLQGRLAAEDASPSEQLVRKEEGERLLEALARLPEREREALILQRYHGRTLAQIAEHIGFEEALAALKRGHELGTRQPGWRYPSARWVLDAERLVALDLKLVAVLKGQAQPAGAAECLNFVGTCRTKKWYAAAARFYADAFAADPKLADDLPASHRYGAACFFPRGRFFAQNISALTAESLRGPWFRGPRPFAPVCIRPQEGYERWKIYPFAHCCFGWGVSSWGW